MYTPWGSQMMNLYGLEFLEICQGSVPSMAGTEAVDV